MSNEQVNYGIENEIGSIKESISSVASFFKMEIEEMYEVGVNNALVISKNLEKKMIPLKKDFNERYESIVRVLEHSFNVIENKAGYNDVNKYRKLSKAISRVSLWLDKIIPTLGPADEASEITTNEAMGFVDYGLVMDEVDKKNNISGLQEKAKHFFDVLSFYKITVADKGGERKGELERYWKNKSVPLVALNLKGELIWTNKDVIVNSAIEFIMTLKKFISMSDVAGEQIAINEENHGGLEYGPKNGLVFILNNAGDDAGAIMDILSRMNKGDRDKLLAVIGTGLSKIKQNGQ